MHKGCFQNCCYVLIIKAIINVLTLTSIFYELFIAQNPELMRNGRNR